jgi:hypothetical protein
MLDTIQCLNSYLPSPPYKHRDEICKIIILPVILCACETWSLVLREEYTLNVFRNKVLRRISGLKRVEVTDYWTELHNKVFHNIGLLLQV